MRGKGAHTAAFTGDLALVCDERQYERGHGACLDASATAAAVLIDDMDREARRLRLRPRVPSNAQHMQAAIENPAVIEEALGWARFSKRRPASRTVQSAP
jgi:hypothetical protein